MNEITLKSLDNVPQSEIDQIAQLQKNTGLDQLQEWVNTGVAWQLEGSIGRQAMEHLKSGALYLPTRSYRDAYGNPVPARQHLKPGTTGTLENSVQFWRAFAFQDEETF